MIMLPYPAQTAEYISPTAFHLNIEIFVDLVLIAHLRQLGIGDLACAVGIAALGAPHTPELGKRRGGIAAHCLAEQILDFCHLPARLTEHIVIALLKRGT